MMRFQIFTILIVATLAFSQASDTAQEGDGASNVKTAEPQGKPVCEGDVLDHFHFTEGASATQIILAKKDTKYAATCKINVKIMSGGAELAVVEATEERTTNFDTETKSENKFITETKSTHKIVTQSDQVTKEELEKEMENLLGPVKQTLVTESTTMTEKTMEGHIQVGKKIAALADEVDKNPDSTTAGDGTTKPGA